MGLLLDRLTEPDKSELLEALADPGVEHTALSRVLKKRDLLVISGQNVGRHRRGDCQCLPR